MSKFGFLYKIVNFSYNKTLCGMIKDDAEFNKKLEDLGCDGVDHFVPIILVILMFLVWKFSFSGINFLGVVDTIYIYYNELMLTKKFN